MEPTSTPVTLKCHFKIHLPFGNKIALKIRLQGDEDANKAPILVPKNIELTKKQSSSINTIDSMKFIQNVNMMNGDDSASQFGELENYSPIAEMNAFLNYDPIDCEDGISIEIINRMNERWCECLLNSIDTNVEFILTLPDNMLMIRIAKHISTKSTRNKLISLEYKALPIEEIVSQCAFGWILIDNFCISPFNEYLSWQDAENQCNQLGGYLASIHSDHEQHVIDNMLINR